MKVTTRLICPKGVRMPNYMTQTNPASFKRNPDDSGRVWSWAYCNDFKCDLCYHVDDNKIHIKEVWLGLCNYDAWTHSEEEARDDA